VDETEKGWYMSIIQRDPAEELAAERRAKRERAEAVSRPPAPAGPRHAARRCGAAPTARAVACARPSRRPRPRPGRLHERYRQAAFLRWGTQPVPGATPLCAHVASSVRQHMQPLGRAAPAPR
jgi:hypothetical protein